MGYAVKTLESKETKASREITVTHNSVFAAHRLQCRMTIHKVDIRHFVLERCAPSRCQICSRHESSRPAKLFHFRCDPPSRAASVFYAAALMFIFFLYWFLNGNRTCVQRASISHINVRHVDVDMRLHRRPTGGADRRYERPVRRGSPRSDFDQLPLARGGEQQLQGPCSKPAFLAAAAKNRPDHHRRQG